jgi:hypothetical protein
MKFIPVEKLPEKNPQFNRSEWKSMRKVLGDFIKMNVKYARVEVDYDDYSSESSARGALRVGARHHKFPVDVVGRNSEIYLIRTDM